MEQRTREFRFMPTSENLDHGSNLKKGQKIIEMNKFNVNANI